MFIRGSAPRVLARELKSPPRVPRRVIKAADSPYVLFALVSRSCSSPLFLILPGSLSANFLFCRFLQLPSSSPSDALLRCRFYATAGRSRSLQTPRVYAHVINVPAHLYSHIYQSDGVVTSGDRYRVPLICHEVERLLFSLASIHRNPLVLLSSSGIQPPLSVSFASFYSRMAEDSLFLSVAMTIFLSALSE